MKDRYYSMLNEKFNSTAFERDDSSVVCYTRIKRVYPDCLRTACAECADYRIIQCAHCMMGDIYPLFIILV